MEKALKLLFDFQRFEKNKELESTINKTMDNYSEALSDDQLEQVAAAGSPEQLKVEDEPHKK